MNGKLPRGHIGGEGGFWRKEPNEILAEGRLGWSDITWGMVEDKDNNQTSRVSEYQGREILMKWM